MSRRALVLLLLVALTSSGFLAGAAEEPVFELPAEGGRDGGGPHAFVWAVDTVPDVGPLWAYRVDAAPTGPLDVLRVARAFDMDMVSMPVIDWDGRTQGSYVGFEGAGRSVSVGLREGEWSYWDESIDALASGNVSYPGDAEAVTIVHRFLVTNGLAPDDAHADAAAVIEPARSQGRCVVGVGCTSVALGKWVAYERHVDDFPAIGGGDRLRLAIGPDGEVLDATVRWPDLDRGGQVRLAPFHEAKARVESGTAMVESDGSCREARLEAVHVAYYVPSPTSGEDWAFPVYTFSGPCMDGATNRTVAVHVSAVR